MFCHIKIKISADELEVWQTKNATLEDPGGHHFADK
jgi:hypothetical protein